MFDLLVVGGPELAPVRSALSHAGYGTQGATSAREAIGAMAATSYAAVIVDGLLPDFDGLSFIRHLRAQNVDVPCIMISAQLSADRRRRVADLGAGLLLKPFRSEQLLSTVRRFLTKQESPIVEEREPAKKQAFHEAFRARVAVFGDGELPVLDRRLACAHELLLNPDTSATDIAKLVEDDMRIVSAILRIVNSPVHGAHEPITDLVEATARLGVLEIVGVIMHMCLRRTFAMDTEPFASLSRASWKRSVAAAKLAAQVSTMRTDLRAVYAAVLLQDVGELVGYGLAAQAMIDAGVARQELGDWAEREVQQVHPQIGERLLRAWSLPDPIPFLAGNHHRPEHRSDPLVQLSESVCGFVDHVLSDAPFIPTSFCANDVERDELAEQVRGWVSVLG